MASTRPARRTAGRAASQKTPAAKAMNDALTAYSKAIGVPDVSASQPARGIPAMPMSPLQVASARMATRSSESVDSLKRGVVMAVMKFPLLVGVVTGSGADAATSDDGGSGPVMRESRETAHSEVLGIGEGECGDRERDRRDHAEFGQRQPTGDEHDGDEDREDDVAC